MISIIMEILPKGPIPESLGFLLTKESVMKIMMVSNPIGEKQALVLSEMNELKKLINKALKAHKFEEVAALREEWNLCHSKLCELDKLVG